MLFKINPFLRKMNSELKQCRTPQISTLNSRIGSTSKNSYLPPLIFSCQSDFAMQRFLPLWPPSNPPELLVCHLILLTANQIRKPFSFPCPQSTKLSMCSSNSGQVITEPKQKNNRRTVTSLPQLELNHESANLAEVFSPQSLASQKRNHCRAPTSAWPQLRHSQTACLYMAKTSGASS